MFSFFRHKKELPKVPSGRIIEIGMKIAELVARDGQMVTFGAKHGHRYQMNPVLSDEELSHFEREYACHLPGDYAEFLTQIGNGGIGPYYGLYSLADSVSDDPGHKCRDFLASPFPLTEFFNPYDLAENQSDDDLFTDRFICGSIVLSHQGCGYYDRLVISGPQAGQVWCDGRVSDQGIAPLGCDFYTWYDQWITQALYKLVA